MPLTLFTNAGLLSLLHRDFLTRLLQDYQDSLPPEAVTLLTADRDLNHVRFCNAWAAQFRSADAFGAPLRDALIAIETLALPENHQLLDEACAHLPEGFTVDDHLPPLHRALHLWFIARTPAYHVTFPIPSPSSVPVSPITASALPQSTFENQNSTISDTAPRSDAPPSDAATQPFNPAASAPTDFAQSKIENQNSTISDTAPHSADFRRLARLSQVEYDLARRAEAKRLHLRLRTLDEAVDRARILDDDAQANDVILSRLTPWPEPIPDAPALFAQVHDRFLLYLHLPPGAAVVFTLWLPHAQAINAFAHSPRLNLTSVEPGCGKSTVLHLLKAMSHKALYTHNLKPAVLFRVIHLCQPVLFLDELDTYLGLYSELRGLLNAGNDPSASVWRCEGHVPRAFKCFAATALAGLGELAPTLRDRSIIIPLTKAPAGTLQARFDLRHTETETLLGRQLARWTQDHFHALAACDPQLPPEAYNRLGDKWRPLFAIAQTIGGHWPQRLLDAFHALTAPTPPAEPEQSQKLLCEGASNAPTLHGPPPRLNFQLLRDLRHLFAQSGADRLFSSTLVHSLRSLPDRPWSAANNGQQPIDQTWLARQLQPFGLAARNIRIANRQAKGYRLADFSPAFAQFLSPT